MGMKLPTKTCRVCGHTWIIRTLDPKRCPSCKNLLVLPTNKKNPRTSLPIIVN